MLNETKAVVLASAVMGVALAPTLFRDINFGELNGAIEILGDSSKDLTPDEKKAAIEVVDEWKTTVLQRLSQRQSELREFLYLFEIPTGSHANTVNHAEEFFSNDGYADSIAAKTETEDTLALVLAARDRFNGQMELRPERIEHFDDEMVSTLQLAKEQSDYRLAVAQHEIIMKRITKDYAVAFSNWIKQINEHEYVKETIRHAKKFLTNVNTYSALCTDKARMARLNIAISKSVARDALRSLLDFSIDM